MNKTLTVILVFMVFATASTFAFVDTLDTTNNFFSSFGGTTATANGDGTVTLTRTVANQDAGIDWRNDGSSLQFSNENLLAITPVAPINGGFYSVNILFFDSGHNFVDEKNWIGDTQLTSVQSTDIVQFAAAQSVVGASEYFVRFRVQPFGDSNVGFKFTEISAIPEPAPIVLVFGAIAALMFVARRVKTTW